MDRLGKAYEGSVSRRDFLKFGGLVLLLSVPGVRMVGKFSLLPPNADEDSVTSHGEIIETQGAIYLPIYERHDKRPNLPEIIKNEKLKVDIHFCEIISHSAELFQKSDPVNLLTTEIVDQNGYSFGRLTDDTTLKYFSSTGTSVAYEGSYLSRKYFEKGLADNSGKDEMVIKFRNLLIARKLQTLAKYHVRSGDQKPVISFSVGRKHGEISNILKHGEKYSLAGFDDFSDSTLRVVTNDNGSIDYFSQTLVISPSFSESSLVATQQTYVDEELRYYLHNRIDYKV